MVLLFTFTSENGVEGMKNVMGQSKLNLLYTGDDLRSFGYSYQGMVGIKRELAMIMYRRGYCTYALFPDDTESMVEEEGTLLLEGVLYGVESDDLSAYIQGWLNMDVGTTIM